MRGKALLPALRTAAPALGHLLPPGQTVVGGTARGEPHTEGSLHLHRPTVSPQPGVAHTGHLPDIAYRDNFRKLFS